MSINWSLVREETAQLLKDLIQINTVNPPGNESEAALYLQHFLKKEGIEATIYAGASNRGNLVATLPGTGLAQSLVLLSHLDVVSANPGQWSHPPFDALFSEEFIWGRGALDMKGMTAMEVMALVLCKRSGQTFRRPLTLVAAADEEAGSQLGIEWLLEQKIPDLQKIEYVINEGGEGKTWNNIPVFSCQSGEKGILWLKLTLKGMAGHASMPTHENVIGRMAALINRLNRRKEVMTLGRISRSFLMGLARERGLKLSENSAANDYSLKMFANRHFRNVRSVQAMLYNTITPTIIKAGAKTNVLADSCELNLDCRLLPGETPEGFLAEVRRIVNDQAVDYEVLQSSLPTESTIDTELYRVMEQVVRQAVPQAVTVPYLSPCATDSRFFRLRGITAYGLMPILINESELQRMHGVDERLSLDNLELGIKILYQIVSRMVFG
jgi:acetylornithine deacetylase/succinyl-diaminopimelate desuccinylase-like protein